jgi:AGZA family xanthine/uracil permease-like MFS transporter
MLQKLLGFDKRTMKIRTELVAGLTAFLTMSYILAVNPAILAATGTRSLPPPLWPQP